jgi:hypothetical protein
MLAPGIRFLSGNVDRIRPLRHNPFQAELPHLLTESHERHLKGEIQPQRIRKT